MEKYGAVKDHQILFHNGIVLLPDRTLEDGVVLCGDGLIQEVGRRADVAVPEDAVSVDAHGEFISPGYVDIHVHGGDGADFMDGTQEAIRNMVTMTSAGVIEATCMASLTPAERTGIAHAAGSLEAGKRADVIVLDKAQNVKRVFIGGCEYRSSHEEQTHTATPAEEAKLAARGRHAHSDREAAAGRDSRLLH